MNLVLELSKEDIGNLLLGSEINVNYGSTNLTVKLNEYSSTSELEVSEDD